MHFAKSQMKKLKQEAKEAKPSRSVAEQRI